MVRHSLALVHYYGPVELANDAPSKYRDCICCKVHLMEVESVKGHLDLRNISILYHTSSRASLISSAKYSAEKGGVDEIRTRDLFVTLALATMSKDQLNQKLKLVVEILKIDIYSIKKRVIKHMVLVW